VKLEWEQAARQGDARALRSQLESGGNVDALDRFGQSALMLAALGGHLEAVEVLIGAGANLNITAKFGLSATMLAVVNGHESVARALAAAGADLSITGSGAPGFAGKTAAALAVDRGLTKLAGELARGLPPNQALNTDADAPRRAG
jgi:ankyrin repeat protein